MLRLPKRNDITPADPREEPTRYYYWPMVGWFYRKRLRMVVEALGNRRYARLLEVAYGSGIFLPTLHGLCDELHGLDLLDRQEVVQETLRKAGVSAHLQVGDALAMPYPNEHFDAVVNVSMLEHL
ncbi:MAG TPA: class I SAM-dependent methyltransferase, partial [Candidatus Hydrogenedentes bacterium]|nr:class I SAM-dependent methyltransferase [Candidatus Hydrogenedentota bacterium]